MTLPNIFFLLFWLSAGVVAYTFVGYPALIQILARFRNRATSKKEESNPPMVSIVLVAYNEAARISSRLENFFAFALCFGKTGSRSCFLTFDQLTGIVEAIPGALKSRVHLIVSTLQLVPAKAAGLNQAIAAAKGDLIVFADARQRFAPDAISRLVSCFADPSVGAVSGSYGDRRVVLQRGRRGGGFVLATGKADSPRRITNRFIHRLHRECDLRHSQKPLSTNPA